jgi:glycosyltransferase involved in cell wall biosynthesis
MGDLMAMKIVVVSQFYSEGMGYTENCLPRSLAALGHDVHVLTSGLNVYGNTAEYDRTYRQFLGDADQGVRSFQTDGYTVHRLKHRLLAGYVLIEGLLRKLRGLRPDVVHCTEIASLQTYLLALARPFLGYRLFAETHQHMSVVKPWLKQPQGQFLKRTGYWLTRTAPTRLASLAVERCYAIAPDCVEVATRFYGVPAAKTHLQSLGTDTELFRPPRTPDEVARRAAMRLDAGFAEDDVVCIYTGRFSRDKNPLLLADAVDRLVSAGHTRFHGLFVGEGDQKPEILARRNTQVRAFARHTDLADLYRIADIAVWPRQESMSMLDAAACELPLVVSDRIGENERVNGNGRVHVENDADDLARVLLTLQAREVRIPLGTFGREKMSRDFSWKSIARSIVADYAAAVDRR